MKRIKIIYWISTGLITLMMLNSAYMCFFAPAFKVSIAHLGFPDFFRIELGIAKFFGALAISLPIVTGKLKEWAYAGFFYMFGSGVVAHISAGDPVSIWGVSFTVLIILLVSYLSYKKLTQMSLAKI